LKVIPWLKAKVKIQRQKLQARTWSLTTTDPRGN